MRGHDSSVRGHEPLVLPGRTRTSTSTRRCARRAPWFNGTKHGVAAAFVGGRGCAGGAVRGVGDGRGYLARCWRLHSKVRPKAIRCAGASQQAGLKVKTTIFLF